MKISLLLVDDEPSEGGVIKRFLDDVLPGKYAFAQAMTLQEAKQAIRQSNPDIILLDNVVPPQNTAAEMVPVIRECGFNGPIVVSTLLPGEQTKYASIEAGVAEYILKPNLTPKLLEEIIKRHTHYVQ